MYFVWAMIEVALYVAAFFSGTLEESGASFRDRDDRAILIAGALGFAVAFSFLAAVIILIYVGAKS
jgi:hypothetical protein